MLLARHAGEETEEPFELTFAAFFFFFFFVPLRLPTPFWSGETLAKIVAVSRYLAVSRGNRDPPLAKHTLKGHLRSHLAPEENDA